MPLKCKPGTTHLKTYSSGRSHCVCTSTTTGLEVRAPKSKCTGSGGGKGGKAFKKGAACEPGTLGWRKRKDGTHYCACRTASGAEPFRKNSLCAAMDKRAGKSSPKTKKSSGSKAKPKKALNCGNRGTIRVKGHLRCKPKKR